jgi:hypothetical protein
MDRLLTQNSLLTNPDEIKNQLHKHFEEYFKEKPSPPLTPNSEFYELYKPTSNQNLFANLFDEISTTEWLTTLKIYLTKKLLVH